LWNAAAQLDRRTWRTAAGGGQPGLLIDPAWPAGGRAVNLVPLGRVSGTRWTCRITARCAGRTHECADPRGYDAAAGDHRTGLCRPAIGGRLRAAAADAGLRHRSRTRGRAAARA